MALADVFPNHFSPLLHRKMNATDAKVPSMLTDFHTQIMEALVLRLLPQKRAFWLAVVRQSETETEEFGTM